MPTKDEYLSIIQAFKFYNVETEGQLVLAMLGHIEKLQNKFPPQEAGAALRQRVREG